MRASEPRTLTRVARDPKTGGYWSYGSVKNIVLLLDAVDQATALTAEEKEGLRGWLKTNLAVQYEDMAQAHDSFGIVLDLPDDPLTEIAPIADKPTVWARIFSLLDEADTHLASAGGSFSFRLHSGFAGFNTPATFRQLNRALYAKYKVIYAVAATNHTVAGNTPSTDAAWNDALTALGQSFLNDGASGLTFAGLHRGPFHVYPAAESSSNPMASTDRFINQRIRKDAQCGVPADCTAVDGDGFRTAGDARAFGSTAKVRVDAFFQFAGVETNLKQTDYLNPSQSSNIGAKAPIPIIRNEELILLRAEANYNLGNYSAAIADLNLIRANRASLPDLSDPYVPDAALNQAPTLLEALLYEKRYSLWAENATVWLDMRRYGMTRLIPHYDPTFRIFEIFPIPDEECRERGFDTFGCFEGGYQGITDGPIL
jgi:hypothetical protein